MTETEEEEEESDEQWTAGEFMTKPVAGIRQDQLYTEAARLMEAKHISGLLVWDAQGTPCGVITTFDILRFEAKSHFMILSEADIKRLKKESGGGGVYTLNRTVDAPVAKLMTSALVTVPPEEPLWKVARRMDDRKIHRVFVQEGEKIVGVVTTLDLARAFRKFCGP